MTLALLAAFFAALAYGVASVLQSYGARGTTGSVLAATRSVPYMAGIGLDLTAFGVSTIALRRLPLFSVQAIVASSVVVTALLAGPMLGGARLRWVDRIAVGAVCAGLVMLGLSAATHPADNAPAWLPMATLSAALFVAAAGTVTVGRSGSGPVLGLLSGAAFGLVSLSVRLMTVGHSIGSWLADPAVYGLAVSGASALFLYAAALQRAHVTTTTAVVITVDALLPATVGVLLLNDHAAAGRGPLAVLGFIAAICGAVVLSRAQLDRPAEGGRHRRPRKAQARLLAARD
ncbi:MAG: hypothetical protein WCB04_02810 [Mycobacteriales bacterium]